MCAGAKSAAIAGQARGLRLSRWASAGCRTAWAICGRLMCVATFSAMAAAPALHEVEWSRFGEEVVVTLKVDGVAEPEALRLWLEPGPAVAPSLRCSRFKVEGLRFYRPLEDDAIAPHGWVAIEDVPAVATEGTLVLLLPGRLLPSKLVWQVEVLDPVGRILARFPPRGPQPLSLAQLPEARPIRDDPPDADRLSSLPDPIEAEIAALQAREWRPMANEGQVPPLFRRVRLMLREVAEEVPVPIPAVPERTEISDRGVRRSGETRGVRWQLYFLHADASDQSGTVLCALESEEDRRLEVSLSYELPTGDWQWHDFYEEARPLSAEGPPWSSTFEWPFGAGRQSRYPIGVVKGSAGLFVLAVPSNAARVFRIQAAGSPQRLEAVFDLGLTRRTARAPLRTSCALDLYEIPSSALAGDPPFRSAWAVWQERHSREIRPHPWPVDLWVLEDTSMGVDLSQEGILPGHWPTAGRRFLVTNPFHVRWPVDTINPPRAEEALRRLRFFAAFDPGALGLAARTAGLAGVRDVTGAPILRFEACEAVWEVNAHPNFLAPPSQPLNRAQAEWATIRAALATGDFAGVLVQDLAVCQTLDLNPAALAVAEGAATWIQDTAGVGLATPLAALDYLRPLHRWLSDTGRPLALAVSETLHPAAIAVADAFIVSFRTLQRDDAAVFADTLRALAGVRPVIVRYDEASPSAEWMQAEMERLLFRGFLPSVSPSLWSGGDEGVGSEPVRWRALWQKYGPWLKRVAQAEWRAIGGAKPRTAGWRLETFGPDEHGCRFITARRAAAAPECGEFVLPLESAAFLLAPLTGQCVVLAPSGGAQLVRVRVAAGRTGFWMLVPWKGLDRELAFLRSWRPPGGEGHALWVQLRNATIEQEARVRSEWLWGTDGLPLLRIQNDSDSPVALSDLRFAWGAQSQTAAADLRILAPREELRVPVGVVAGALDESVWLSAQWRLARADREWDCASRIRIADIGGLSAAEETDRR